MSVWSEPASPVAVAMADDGPPPLEDVGPLHRRVIGSGGTTFSSRADACVCPPLPVTGAKTLTFCSRAVCVAPAPVELPGAGAGAGAGASGASGADGGEAAAGGRYDDGPTLLSQMLADAAADNAQKMRQKQKEAEKLTSGFGSGFSGGFLGKAAAKPAKGKGAAKAKAKAKAKPAPKPVLRCDYGPCSKTQAALTAAGGSFSKCARCKAVRYCSRDCQRAHWKNGHKQECGKVGLKVPAVV